MSANRQSEPKLSWDLGTAYDFFHSLAVLHMPSKFGVRAAWSAGMRARLCSESREILETAQTIFLSPLHWIYGLPEPKDVESALWTLGRTSPEDILEALTVPPARREEPRSRLLHSVREKGTWNESDREALQEALSEAHGGKFYPDALVKNTLDAWANAGAFGEAYLKALREYQRVFFSEEERRILPALTEALDRAKALSERLSLTDLIEELSHGIRMDGPLPVDELIIAPSFWVTPLISSSRFGDGRMILLFGARSPSASLVPGETVPDSLMQALKALADPTRLKILRLIHEEPLGAAELARKLRLRTPTMTHHLQALRVAGLLRVQLPKEGSKEKAHYALRPEMLGDIGDMLRSYLVMESEE